MVAGRCGGSCCGADITELVTVVALPRKPVVARLSNALDLWAMSLALVSMF
jgi:hypothetical protein